MAKTTPAAASAAAASSRVTGDEGNDTAARDAVEAARIDALVEERLNARLVGERAHAEAAARAATTLVRKPVENLDLHPPTFGSTDGYGNTAQHLAIELERLGIHVRIVGTPLRCDPTLPAAEKIFERSKTDTVRGDAILFMGQPCGPLGTGGWIAQRERPAFGLSMFEADDIPGVWTQGLSRVHELWTASAHSSDVFRRHVPAYVGVHTVPLGVDVDAFVPKRRARGAKLRFLHHCSYASEYRKGVDLAVDAFARAFPDRDDVELIIHSAFGPVDLPQRDARVRVEIGRYDVARLAALYYSADALLYPSRGEGFGLVPLEAMATGMPAIYAARTGMAEYGDYGLTVGARPMPSRIGVGRAGVDVGSVEATWYEPNVDELVARLREVDERYDAVQDRAFTDAAAIAERFSWAACAVAVKARLNSPDPLRIVEAATLLPERAPDATRLGDIMVATPRF